MKKFFTLIAAVAMAASVNAQTVEWNFSNWETAKFTETMKKDGLTLTMTSAKGMEVDENSKTVGEVTYTKRLKFGGKGEFNSDNTPKLRVVDFDVTGAVDIYIVAAASNKTEAKTVCVDVVETGSEEKVSVGTIELAGNEYKGETVKYSGKGGKIFVYPSATGAVNLYTIKVTPATSTGISSVNASASAKSTATYNLAGQQVSDSYKGIVIKNGKKYVK